MLTSALRHQRHVADFLGLTNSQRLIVPPRLVVLGGVERELADQFTVVGDDANVEVGHQDSHPTPSIASPETEVVQRSSIAQGHAAGVVDSRDAREFSRRVVGPPTWVSPYRAHAKRASADSPSLDGVSLGCS